MRRAAIITVSLLAVLGCGAARATAGAPPTPSPALGRALAAIDACIARLDAEVDVGYRHIAARCPNLSVALAAGGFDRWLPSDWRDPDGDLSAGGLEQLRELLAQELGRAPVSSAPSVRRLRQVLSEIGRRPAQPEAGLWSRLESRLHGAGERSGESASAGNAGGLERLVRSIELTPGAAELVGYAGLAAVLALAVVIVVNELRAAGLWYGRRRPARRRSAQDAAAAVRGSAATDGAAPADRVGLLLALVLERLGRARGLTGLRSLTSRELIGAVALEDVEDARRLASLALAAEHARYAPAPGNPAELAAAIEGARTLLSRFGAP